MQKKRAQGRLIATWFTIQIIRKDHAASGGRHANVRLNTRKTGTLSGGAFAFTRFMACHCSKSSEGRAFARPGRAEARPSGSQSRCTALDAHNQTAFANSKR